MAFSLLFIEGLLWIANYPGWMRPEASLSLPLFYEPDSLVGWRKKPGLYRYSVGNRVIEMTFWPDNSRATRISQTPAGQQAVLFLGCSFTEGYGLSDYDSIPWKVQLAFPEFDVRNFGTGGYGTYQSPLSLKEYFRDNPKVTPKSIVYLFNDFHESRNVGAVDWQTRLTLPPEGSGFHFPFVDVDSSGDLIAIRSRGLIPWWPARHIRVFALVNESYWLIRSLKRLSHKMRATESLLAEMNHAAASRGSQLYVTFLRFGKDHQAAYQAFLNQSQVRWIDCNMPEQYESQFRLEDGHPNDLMNKKTADCVAQALRRPNGPSEVSHW